MDTDNRLNFQFIIYNYFGDTPRGSHCYAAGTPTYSVLNPK